MKKLIIIVLIAVSCSEEDIGPCAEMARNCENILKQRDQATTEKEKEQLYQFYLAERHNLEACSK